MSRKKGPGQGRYKPTVVKAEIVGSVATIPKAPPVVFQICPEHPDISYRHGGFCERCFNEQSVVRVKQLDDAINEKVITQVGDIIEKILGAEDIAVVERFLGRVLSRFERPKESHIHGTLRAVHLHAPMDFGKGKGDK